ncbi:BrnA antitoxin of type II toxin-antitoxin system [Rhodothalassium salexigens DSM 2132]|uniref:BrnA antitoxin of type II toxin-antitoxin system n=1 Tax=Rhodothalassium salexigens DSM 2132 TaxID=1188247 RepID=A0A4R2P3Z5_RHOSA|nr:BrnA antitoxin family protein [Rhodothalassium salexigens]MBB4212817.1 uncharacterized protein (DUF4415 family) [Rhodothalassium salexigens DSM 2132]TCP29510.1 BrnA antitoxin of type II toxin-antitoxin system [Rhodothalassium salexigens DSM 2132]
MTEPKTPRDPIDRALDPDDVEFTDAMMRGEHPGFPRVTNAERARLPLPKKLPGRPPGSSKTRVNLHLDNDVLAHFKAGGRGYQTRINEALRRAIEEELA